MVKGLGEGEGLGSGLGFGKGKGLGRSGRVGVAAEGLRVWLAHRSKTVDATR